MPTGGFRTAAATEVARLVSTTTNGSGVWSLVLERNADISPANTYYQVTEHIPESAGGKRTWNISVGSSDQTVLAALVNILTPAQGSAYLTQAAADARYQALGGLGASTPTTITPDSAGTAGVSSSASRQDHDHPIAAAAPVATGDANAEGTGNEFARATHVHKGVVANEAWSSWTPTLTNLTLGSGTVTAVYQRVGRTIHFRFSFLLGSDSAVGETPTFSLPVAVAASYTVGNQGDFVGRGAHIDQGTANYDAAGLLTDTTTLRLLRADASGASSAWGAISSTVPFTWASTDRIFISGTYEAAS